MKRIKENGRKVGMILDSLLALGMATVEAGAEAILRLMPKVGTQDGRDALAYILAVLFGVGLPMVGLLWLILELEA